MSGWGQEVQAQAGSERALVPWTALIFGVQQNGVQVDPHLGFLGAPEANVFLLEGRQRAACSSGLPNWRACGPAV